jgi:hypothetical protein
MTNPSRLPEIDVDRNQPPWKARHPMMTVIAAFVMVGGIYYFFAV